MQELNAPIVFIHRGYSNLLCESIRLARIHNPNRKIFLITDCLNEYSSINADLIDIKKHLKCIEPLCKSYCHASDLDIEFELFCIARWYILSDFLKHYQLKKAIHLDYDCLTFSSFEQLIKNYQQCDMTLSYGNGFYCGHIAVIESDLLNHFCSYVTDIFETKSSQLLSDLANDINQVKIGFKKFSSPINDMRLLTYFRLNHNYLFGDTTQINNLSSYDHNINSEESGYLMENGTKKLIWEGGFPYAFHSRKNTLVRMNLLHLQGDAKKIAGNILEQHKYSLATKDQGSLIAMESINQIL